MTFTTKFRIGQRVRKRDGHTFVVGQIRIRTFGPLGGKILVLIEYRRGSTGAWVAEIDLQPVGEEGLRNAG